MFTTRSIVLRVVLLVIVITEDKEDRILEDKILGEEVEIVIEKGVILGKEVIENMLVLENEVIVEKEVASVTVVEKK